MELLIGLVIGFVIGASGVGGGTLTAPALIAILRFSPRTAVATALVFSAAVKIAAAIVYVWRRQVNFRVLGYLLVGGMPGALLGAVLINQLKSRTADSWLIALIGILVIVSAASGLLRFSNDQSGAQLKPRSLLFFGLPIGFETGFSSAGAGALASVLLLNVASLAPTAVVGTDLLFGMFTSAAGGAVHALTGNCNWASLALLVPGGLTGAVVGARFGHALPSHIFRRSLLLWAAFMGLLLIYKGLFSK